MGFKKAFGYEKGQVLGYGLRGVYFSDISVFVLGKGDGKEIKNMQKQIEIEVRRLKSCVSLSFFLQWVPIEPEFLKNQQSSELDV